jgi:hypothetical protein
MPWRIRDQQTSLATFPHCLATALAYADTQAGDCAMNRHQ